jgi:hypothetical protein
VDSVTPLRPKKKRKALWNGVKPDDGGLSPTGKRWALGVAARSAIRRDAFGRPIGITVRRQNADGDWETFAEHEGYPAPTGWLEEQSRPLQAG